MLWKVAVVASSLGPTTSQTKVVFITLSTGIEAFFLIVVQGRQNNINCFLLHICHLKFENKSYCLKKS